MAAQVTPQVAQIAADQNRSDDSVEVVLELDQSGVDLTGNKAERIEKQKSLFHDRAEPVKAAVVQSGGSVEGEAWINCTIKARVPARAVNRLREIDGVLKIDVPHLITRE